MRNSRKYDPLLEYQKRLEEKARQTEENEHQELQARAQPVADQQERMKETDRVAAGTERVKPAELDPTRSADEIRTTKEPEAHPVPGQERGEEAKRRAGPDEDRLEPASISQREFTEARQRATRQIELQRQRELTDRERDDQEKTRSGVDPEEMSGEL